MNQEVERMGFGFSSFLPPSFPGLIFEFVLARLCSVEDVYFWTFRDDDEGANTR